MVDPSLLRKVDNSYIYGYYCTSPMLWEKLVGLAVGLVMVGLAVGLDVVGELVGLAVGMGRPETLWGVLPCPMSDIGLGFMDRPGGGAAI